MKNQFKNKRAFTLIELLIVIAIIGILFIVLVSKVDFATDKAKASGVQTDFRSFQMAFDTVAKENAGFNTFGYNTGDNAGAIPSGYAFESTEAENKTKGDGIRNSYDQGDKNLNGKQDDTEVWTGRKIYTEKWTEVYTLVKPGTTGLDTDAIFALESAINKNLDPKLHITIASDGKITMANQARDPWKNEYHGVYISNAERDHGADRGAIIIYSNGANGKWGSAHDITNGVVSVTVPGNNTYGKDDYSLVSCYTFTNGYGEVLNMSTGFSNNQVFNGNAANAPNAPSVIPGDGGNAGGNGGTEPDVNEPIPVVGSATFFYPGATLSWEELQLPENGTKYDYDASLITNTSIEDLAFKDCSNLLSITIPDSVTSIGNQAFYGCWRLHSITVDSDNEAYKSIDGTLYTKDGKTLMQYAAQNADTSFISPASVKTINSYAFKDCMHLTSVIIGDSVTSIGENAFLHCDRLTSVTIGNGVEIISERAFYDCDSLTSVTIPDSVTSIGKEAFYGCNNLTSITIPDSVTSIGNQAFSGCSLTSVVIPDSVTSISHGAFRNCTSLTSITIPDSVTSIGNYAFEGCSSLTSIVIPDSVTSIGVGAFKSCGFTSFTIPDSITSIGSDVFKNCSSLASVNIHDSVTSIDYKAFLNCDSLTSINVDENNSMYKSIDGSLYSKDGKQLIQYAIGKANTSFTIPDSVTYIGSHAFYDCNNLTSVTIPDSITTIGLYAFQYCSSLTSVTIGNGVKTINSYTFSNCTNLKSVTIGNSVTRISSNAFYYCSSLTSVTIPDSVTTISISAFEDCTSLTSITFNGSTEQWNAVNKGSQWKNGVPATYVQCSDGRVDI